MATLLPLLSTICIAVSGILVAFGWYHIVHGHRKTHQRLMVSGAIFALLFFIIYISRTVFIGDMKISSSSPETLRDVYYIFLIFHIILATVSAVFGMVTLILASKQKFTIHRKIGRWTAVLWLLTAPTGIMVYLVLYIFYPGELMKPLIDTMMGS